MTDIETTTEGGLVLADYFGTNVAVDDSNIVYADPDDDPLANLAPALQYLRFDGTEGIFYDGDKELGRTLDCVILDYTRVRQLWTPTDPAEDKLYNDLKDFPAKTVICGNGDVENEKPRFAPTLSADQRSKMELLGAGDCNTCDLTKAGCKGGRKLLIFNPNFDEPLAIQFGGTSIGPVTALFRKEFKVKGQSIAICSRPVRFGADKKEGVDKNGKPTKYYQVTASAGGFLPPAQVNAFLALRDTYRIRARGVDHHAPALPSHDNPALATGAPAEPSDPGRLI
jgi:hypothetical protein